MNHPIYHAWDCSCGARNAPELPACFRCGSPASAGQPVYLAGPRVQEPGPPAKQDPWAWSPKAMIGWGIAGIVMFVLTWFLSTPSLYTWILLVLGLVFFAAGHIIEASRR